MDDKRFKIKNGVLVDCKNVGFIEDIVIPHGVEVIGKKAFKKTMLRSVTIPTSVKRIEPAAFDKCELLVEVNYLGTVEQWLQIQRSEDGLCGWLKIDGNPIEHLVIPDGTEAIRMYAFRGIEEIKSVYIPDSVVFISPLSFSSVDAISIPPSVGNFGWTAFGVNGRQMDLNVEYRGSREQFEKMEYYGGVSWTVTFKK